MRRAAKLLPGLARAAGGRPALTQQQQLLLQQPQWRPAGLLGRLRGYASLPPHTKLAMPALSPTMTQGNISRWCVKPGDEIAPGTVLAEIETDKATLAFENQEEGFVAAILKPEGAKDVPVGEPVAIIVEEADDVAAFANYASSDASSSSSTSSSSAAAASSPAAAPAAAAGAAGPLPEHIPLRMPALSPTMEQGNIVSWAVKEGDEVGPGTVLAEIETDKATLAFENQDEGFIAKILAPAGSKDVKVGQLVAIIVEDAEAIPAFAAFTGDGAAAPSAAAGAAAAAPAAAAAAPRVEANVRLGPAARAALEEAGLTRDDVVSPSGPHGIITKGDVMAAVAAGVKHGAAAGAAPAAPAAAAAPPSPPTPQQQPAAAVPAAAPLPTPPPGADYTDIPASQVRQIIAKRLLESKLGAPSLYVSVDVALDALDALRKSLAAEGTKVSVNDCVVRAAALALRDVPDANVRWDDAAGGAVRQPAIDVCIAVATDGGLITPIVKGADGKGLMQLSAEVKQLASRARANKLLPEEFMGGSFSISNLGMFGLSSFSAIINPPQAAILAVGGSQRSTVVDARGHLRSEARMSVTLTADHRAIDGELASRLLAAFKGYMEQPLKLLL